MLTLLQREPYANILLLQGWGHPITACPPGNCASAVGAHQPVAPSLATYLADIPDHLPPATEEIDNIQDHLEQKINAVTISLAMLEEARALPGLCCCFLSSET